MVGQVGFIAHCNKRHQGTAQCVLERHDRGLLGDLRQGSRKWGFALHWMLSKSRGNAMIRYLHKS